MDDLNSYTGLFSDEPATITVGQVKEGSEQLQKAADDVKTEAESLETAIEEHNKAQEERAAEQQKSTGTTSTTIVEVEFQSAAYALQVSWSTLLTEAGCLDEDEKALDGIKQFTAGLQRDLTTLGFFSGTVDGIYGPGTVGSAGPAARSREVPRPSGKPAWHPSAPTSSAP